MNISDNKLIEVLNKRKELIDLNNQITELQEVAAKTRHELQEQCPHCAIARVNSNVSSLGTFTEERRLCLICGFEEERCSYGYKSSLGNDHNIVVHCGTNRDKFFKLRSLEYDLKPTVTIDLD